MKKDLAVVIALAALAAAAFLLTGERGGGARAGPVPLDPYRPEPGDRFLARYHSEGGPSQIPLFDVSVRGPGECPVRYQIRGRPAVERTIAVSDAQFRDLLERLARVEFFEVDEVPRGGRPGDVPSTAIALTIRDRESSIRIDARRRASRDLGPLVEFFEDLRKAATPEPVSSGD